MSIFSNIVSNINPVELENDTNYIEFNKNKQEFFDINNISYNIEKVEDTIKITINSNFINEVFTYSIGENPLTDLFTSSNIFIRNSLDTTNYKMSIKTEKEILVIFDEINVSTF
jgi:hypothetical protein